MCARLYVSVRLSVFVPIASFILAINKIMQFKSETLITLIKTLETSSLTDGYRMLMADDYLWYLTHCWHVLSLVNANQVSCWLFGGELLMKKEKNT